MKLILFFSILMACGEAFCAEPFRLRAEISPNDFRAVRFDPKNNSFSQVELAPDPLAPHAELVKQALERVPSWLREDVHAQLRALLMSPIRLKGVTAMAFEDVNRDGKPDLIVAGEEKKMRVFLAPLWIEGKADSKLRVDAEGRIVGLRSGKRSTNATEFFGVNVGADNVSAWGDVTGDGLMDIVVTDKSGIMTFRRNVGSPSTPRFAPFSNEFNVLFRNLDIGLALRPSPYGSVRPDKCGLAVGNKDGALICHRSESAFSTLADDLNPPPRNLLDVFFRRPHYFWKTPTPAQKSGSAAPSWFCSKDGKTEGFLIGYADGALSFVRRLEWKLGDAFPELTQVGDFAAPAFGDLDGDGDWDLVIGNGAGELKVFKNLEVEKGKIAFEEITDKSPLGKIKVNHSASPALGDVNGDGKADLLLGAQDGTLRLFSSPDFAEEKEAFAGARVGALSAPAFIDVNGDGKLDVVVGNARGQLLYYENVSKDGKLAWVEKYSKDLSEKNEDGSVKREIKYAGNYYREREMLFGANDTMALEDYAKLLRDCPKEFVDEIAFVIAHTSAEVLRTMSRAGQSDILLENAKAIYEMAGQLKYVSLKEHGDYTTLEVMVAQASPPVQNNDPQARTPVPSVVKKEIPRDIYYWWVVHPRIYHEIPWRVDASWWDKKPEERGMKLEDWLRHNPEPDPKTLTEKSTFWRTSLPRDNSHGKSLLDVVKDAPTVRDAVERLHWWMSQTSPEGFMRFGYLTNDGQPNVAFKKAYGSCGEFSILSTALSRTALIPTALISKFGEDHQWVEFYEDGNWVHWDASQLPGVDAPWASNEGRRHEHHLSAVFRTWGNDYADCTTATVFNPVWDFTQAGAGYTDTGSVTVTVRDARGRAVDGAMVVVHNRDGGNHNLVTWGYTDAKGQCLIRLGSKPNGGYSFEVVSPYGQAGTEMFHVAEGKTYSLDYQLTGQIKNPWQEFVAVSVSEWKKSQFAKPQQSIPLAHARGYAAVELNILAFDGLLRPPSFFTSHPQTVGTAEFFGVHQFPHPLDNAGSLKLLVLDKENFEKFKARKPFKIVLASDIAAAEKSSLLLPRRELFFVFVNIETQRVHHQLDATFEISVPSATQGSPATERVLTLRDALRRVRCLHAVTTERDPPQPINLQDESETARFSPATDTDESERKPIPPMFEKPPTREFKNVLIFQDDEHDHLKKTGWILGPFRIVGKERFLRITSDSPTKDFDLDLYLYADKNGNGKVDGASELVGKSTTPEAREEIWLHLPEDTTYWLYCHGCRVKGKFGLMNLQLSFDYKPSFIADFEPVRWVNQRTATASAKFVTPFEVKHGDFSVTHNGRDVTTRCKLERTHFFFVLPDTMKEGEKQQIVVTAKDGSGNEDVAAWEFIVDVTPPTLEILSSPEGREVSETFEIQFKAMDNARLASVIYQLNDAKPVALPPDKTENSSVNVLSLADGEHKLALKAADVAGNETVREMKFTVKNPPIAVASVSPADGAKINDDRPVIRVNLWSRGEIDEASVRMFFDGEDVTAKMRYVAKNKQAVFIPPFLKRGKHSIAISVSDKDGNKVEKHTTTFEVE